MGLLNLASASSVWRGYEYYSNNKVINYKKISETEFEGVVQGSGNHQYKVSTDLEHPRKSKCNCPHADGRRVICKHIIALYFTAFPKHAKDYYDEVLSYQEAEEKYQKELEDKLIAYVHELKKEELAPMLLQLLFEGPEWQYEKFIREYIE